MDVSNFDNEIASERAKLALEAKQLLGYNRMANALVLPDKLAFKLRELNISPLETSKVEAYKRSKEKVTMWSSRKQAWYAAFASGAMVALTVRLAVLLNAGVTAKNGWELMGAMGCGSVAIILCVASLVAFNQRGEGIRYIWGWKEYSIQEFSELGNIPEHALDKAIAIKRELPAVLLRVDCLGVRTEERENPRPAPDPFLKVSLGDEHFYIDVWDEKEYERLA
jgi:hypothetical protein